MLLNCHLQAQNYSTESKDVELCFRAFSNDLGGGDEEMIAVLSRAVLTAQAHHRGRAYTFTVYDDELNESYSKLVDTEDFIPDDMTLSQVFVQADKVFGLGYKTDPKKKTNELYLLEFDRERFRFLPDMKLISRLVGKSYLRDFHHAFTNVDFSNDGSKVLISHRFNEINGLPSFRVMTFNEKMQMTGSHDVIFSHEEKKFLLQGKDWEIIEGSRNIFFSGAESPFEIDDFGNIHTYGRDLKDRKNWWLCTINNGEKHYSRLESNVDFRVNPIELSHPENSENTWFVGWYSDKVERQSGLIIQKLNGVVPEDPIYLAWDTKTLGELMDLELIVEKYEKKGKGFHVPIHPFKEWYLLENDELVLVMEHRYFIGEPEFPMPETRGRLLLTKVDFRGRIYQTEVLHKQGQCYLFMENDNLNVFYQTSFYEASEDYNQISQLGLSSLHDVYVLKQVSCSDLKISDKIVLWSQYPNGRFLFREYKFELKKFGDKDHITWSQVGAQRGIFLFKSLKK